MITLNVIKSNVTFRVIILFPYFILSIIISDLQAGDQLLNGTARGYQVSFKHP